MIAAIYIVGAADFHRRCSRITTAATAIDQEQHASFALESADFSRRQPRHAGRHLHRQRLQNHGARRRRQRGVGNDGRTRSSTPTPPIPTNASCSTSSRKWPSPPACPCRRSMSWTTRTASTPSPPATQPGDATVTVTRGCMKLLSRDELQGVIGHEFSHILNGDMRLNLRLMGIIFGILCLAIIGRVLLVHAQRRRARARPKSAADCSAWCCCSSASSAFFLAGSSRPPSAASANFSPTPRPCNSRAIPAASPAR